MPEARGVLEEGRARQGLPDAVPDVPDVGVQQGLPGFPPGPVPVAREAAFACNGCHRRYGMGCGYEYRFYDGRMAHDLAQKRKVESREGIDVTPEELEAMRSIVRPLIKKGQSPEVIWATRAGELPASLSTFYRYVEMGGVRRHHRAGLAKESAIQAKEETRRRDPDSQA